MLHTYFYSKIFLILAFSLAVVLYHAEFSSAQISLVPESELKISKPMKAIMLPQLKLDKSSYKTSESIKVSIKHPDSNKDSKVIEKFGFVAFSEKNPAEKQFEAKETGTDSGVFLANVPVEQITTQDDTVTVALKGSYGSVKKSASIIAPCITPPTLELDKKVYSWADEVFITIVSPCNNLDSNLVDQIGKNPYPVSAYTKGYKINPFVLPETGTDTGIFSGRIVLTGFDLDANGDGSPDTNPKTSAAGPGKGFLQTTKDDGITFHFQFNGKTYSASSLIRFNAGEIFFTGDKNADAVKVRVIDPDINVNNESFDVLFVKIISDDDPSGIKLKLQETTKISGVFEGTVTFTKDKSSGDKLKAIGGSKVTAIYFDNTIPSGNGEIKTSLTRPGSSPEPVEIKPEMTIREPVKAQPEPTLNEPTLEMNQHPTLQGAINMLAQKQSSQTVQSSNLVTVVNQKESEVSSKEAILSSAITRSFAENKFLVEQEELLLSKIDYLNWAQAYIDSGQAPVAFVNAYHSQLEKVKEQRKEIAYTALQYDIVPAGTQHFVTINPMYLPYLQIPKSLDTYLFLLATEKNPQAFAKKTGLQVEGKNAKVVLDLKGTAQFTEAEIKKLGGTVEAKGTDQIQVVVPIENLQGLADIPSIKHARPPSQIIQHQVTGKISEGVPFINADIVQEGGFTGKGINIALLDLAFDPSNPEISQNIKEQKLFRKAFGKTYPIGGNGAEYVHGTAVAEIIVDVAPDVNLHLYTIGTEVEFQEVIDYAISRGDIDIIAMSAGWLNYPTDGQSPMSKKLEEATNRGIAVVLSAGNYAEGHWEGNIQDADDNDWLEFAPQDEGLRFDIEPGKTSPIILHMMWQDNANLDLYLFAPHTEEIVAFSQNLQTGASDDVNLETITFNPTVPGTYQIGIHNPDSQASRVQVELFSPSHRLEYSIPQGSVSVPTDAWGIIAVGAIHHSDASLEPYSSQGPTNNGKQVPNVMGPDAVSTLEYTEFCQQKKLAQNISRCQNFPFYGTSAAAPYVAGVAALLLEQNPDLLPSQIITRIQNNADKDIVLLRSAFDNVYGHGKVDAKFIVIDEGRQLGLDVSEVATSNSKPKTTAATAQDYSAIEDKIPVDQTKGYDDKITGDKSQTFGNFEIGGQESKGETQMTPSSADIPSANQEEKVPTWVKSNALWWSNGAVSDDEFVNGIEFLIQNDIMEVESVPEQPEEEPQEKRVPEWVKTNSKWWASGMITEEEFIQAMEYLVKQGIIKLK